MTETLLDLVPADAKFNPSLRALTKRAQRFVIALVELGGQDLKEAARMAGYEGSPNALAVTASRLAADPRVQAALLEEAKGRFAAASLSASTVAIQIMEDPTAPKRDRLSATKQVLAFAGMAQNVTVTQNVNHQHTIAVTTQEQIDQVRELAVDLGLDPRKLLGKVGVTIDAEFTEVVEAVEHSTEGLEDVL